MSRTAQDARDHFLARYSLSMEGYTAPDFPVHLGPLVLRFPNPGLLRFHDLHHVATGYPATVLGEAQISAFELRAGCRSFLVHCLCLGAVALGLVRRPRLMWRAWRLARGARTLYYTRLSYETLLGMSVPELRAHLGIPPEGFCTDWLEVESG